MTENLPTKSEFQIMDDLDSKQIEEADQTIKQALVYDSKGKKQLTLVGIKWLVLKMSQNNQPLKVDLIDAILTKHDESDQKTWIWYATVKSINKKTEFESIGTSEQPYLDQYGNGYDSFGRTKAISKAERNSFRKQIPELEISAMLENVEKKDIHHIDKNTDTEICVCCGKRFLDKDNKSCRTCHKPFSPGVLEFMLQKKNTEIERFCNCDKFIPGSVNPLFCGVCLQKNPGDK